DRFEKEGIGDERASVGQLDTLQSASFMQDANDRLRPPGDAIPFQTLLALLGQRLSTREHRHRVGPLLQGQPEADGVLGPPGISENPLAAVLPAVAVRAMMDA